jgi:hypothetical protein
MSFIVEFKYISSLASYEQLLSLNRTITESIDFPRNYLLTARCVTEAHFNQLVIRDKYNSGNIEDAIVLAESIITMINTDIQLLISTLVIIVIGSLIMGFLSNRKKLDLLAHTSFMLGIIITLVSLGYRPETASSLVLVYILGFQSARTIRKRHRCK